MPQHAESAANTQKCKDDHFGTSPVHILSPGIISQDTREPILGPTMAPHGRSTPYTPCNISILNGPPRSRHSPGFRANASTIIGRSLRQANTSTVL